MSYKEIKIFLASSSELEEDRKGFKDFISDENEYLNSKRIKLTLIKWEDSFLEALTEEGLQNEYNKAIAACDIFIVLFFTKVGRYTNEEFDIALKEFHLRKTPSIFIFEKDAGFSKKDINEEDILSLFSFRKRIDTLNHYNSQYTSTDNLKILFKRQLEKYLERKMPALSFVNPNWLVEYADILQKNFIAQVKTVSSENGENNYIELLVKGQLAANENEENQKEENKIEQGKLSDFVCNRQPQTDLKWLLTGEGGSGKSTSLLKLASDSASAALKDDKAPIPIYVKLNFFDKRDGGFDRLCAIISKELGEADVDTFKELYLKNERPFLFLLDGFNEIGAEFQNSCQLALEELLQNKFHSYIITARSGSLTESLGRIRNIKHLKVEPFDNGQIRQYLVSQGALRLYRQLDEQLKGLLRNPFMLWALTESCKNLPGKELPGNIGQLYENFIDNFIFNGRESKFTPKYDYYCVKKVVLGKLAFFMTEHSITRIKRDTILEKKLIDWIETQEKEFKRKKKILPDDWNIDDFLNEITQHGILRSIGDTYEFMHQTVQEYFTAVDIAELPVQQQIKLVPGLKSRRLDFGRPNIENEIEVSGWFRVPLLMLTGIFKEAERTDEFLIALSSHNVVMTAICVSASTKISDGTKESFMRIWRQLLNKKNPALQCIGCMCFGYSKIENNEVTGALINLVNDDSVQEIVRSTAAKAIGYYRGRSSIQKLVTLAMQSDKRYSEYTWGKILRSINSTEVVRQLFECFRDKTEEPSYHHKAQKLLETFDKNKIADAFIDAEDEEISKLINECINVTFEYEYENYYPAILKNLNTTVVIGQLIDLYVLPDQDESYYEKIRFCLYSYDEITLKTEVEKIAATSSNKTGKKFSSMQELLGAYRPKPFGFPHISELVGIVKKARRQNKEEQELFYVSSVNAAFELLIGKLESGGSNERIAVIKIIGERKEKSSARHLLNQLPKEQYKSWAYDAILDALSIIEEKQEIMSFYQQRIDDDRFFYMFDLNLSDFQELFKTQDFSITRMLQAKGINAINEDGWQIVQQSPVHWCIENFNARRYFEIRKLDNELFSLYDLTLKLKLIGLTRILDNRVIPSLKRFVNADEHSVVRQAALTALARYQAFDLITCIDHLLDFETNSDVIESCITLLGESNSEFAVSPLLKILKQIELTFKAFSLFDKYSFSDSLHGTSSSESWVDRIFNALQQIKDQSRIWPALINFFEDSEDELKRVSLMMVANLVSDKQVIMNILFNALKDKDSRLRIEAVKILYRLNYPECYTIFSEMAITDEAPDVRKAAVSALRFSDNDDILRYLKEKFEEADGRKRAYAITALGDLMDEAASGPLEMLFKQTEDPAMKILAASSLNKIGNYSDASFIIDGLLPLADKPNNAEIIRDAAKCLCEIPHGMDKIYEWLDIAFSRSEYAEIIERIGVDTVFNPDDYVLYYARGLAFFYTHQNERAVLDFTRTLEMNSYIHDGYYFRFQAFVEMNRLDDALKDIEMAVRNAPQNINYHLALGNFYYNINDYTSSIKSFIKILEIEKDDLNSNFNLGLVYLANGESVEAFDQYRHTTEIYYKSENEDKAKILDESIKDLIELGETRRDLQSATRDIIILLEALKM